MVGIFSAIQTFHVSSSHRRDRVPLSVSVLIVTLILLHTVLADRASASPAHISRAMLRMEKSNKLYKASYKQSNVLTHKLQHLSQRRRAELPSHSHRHSLVIGTYAVAATGATDHPGRALVGSSPPSCIKKCGKCTPCKSVLVPIPTTNFPATPAEYYPEAWRCQCKGKLYDP